MSNKIQIPTKYCSTIGSCPFSFSDDSEMVQGYGCLPTPYEIVNMRIKHKKTWACHSNTDKPCLGAINYLKDKNLPYNVEDSKLLTLTDNWQGFYKH